MKMNERIKELRLHRGMTQEELARATGYTSSAAITLIEKGTRDIPSRKVNTFAKALGVSESYLLTGREEQNHSQLQPDLMVTTNNGKEYFFELVTTVAQMDQEQVKRVLEYAKLLEAAKNSK